MKKSFHTATEKELQVAVHNILSDPSKVYKTKSGKRLQILSPGRINVNEGPDFLDIAMLLDGLVIVGDAEFHRYSSEWLHHNHHNDKRYDTVILHIVLANDTDLNGSKELLILDSDVAKIAFDSIFNTTNIKTDAASIEELQHYALLRLLRKSSEAKKLINNSGLEAAHKEITRSFVEKYNRRRRRPVYNNDILSKLIFEINNSPAFEFLQSLKFSKAVSIPDAMYLLLKTKFLEIGSHLRRELLLNCVLPLALCLANEESRINLLLWYWSTPALHKYGLLSRRFKNLPQNFLWQQQGMLEYIREHGRKTNVVSEALRSYGFAEVLSFYKLARPPFKAIEEDEL